MSTVLPVLSLAALLFLFRKKKVEKRLFLLILCGNLLGLGLTVRENLTGTRIQVTESRRRSPFACRSRPSPGRRQKSC